MNDDDLLKDLAQIPSAKDPAAADLAAVPKAPPAPPVQQTISDYAKRFARGAASQLVTVPGQLMVRAGLQPVTRDLGLRLEKQATDAMSPAAKAVDASSFLGEGGDVFGPYPVQKALSAITESAPGLIGLAASGRLAARPLQQAQVGERVTGAVTGAGVPQVIAKGAGEVAETAPYWIGEGLQAGGANAAQVGQQLRDAGQTPVDKMASTDAFQQAMRESLTANPGWTSQQHIDAVRESLAQRAESEAFDKTALATGGIGAITGAGALGVLNRRLGGHDTGGFLRTMRRGAVEEALQEMPQSGGEQLIANYVARKYGDPEQSLLEGVGEAVALGGVAGAATGGGLAAGTYPFTRRRPDEAPPGAAPEPMAPPPDPSGPLGAAVAAGQQSGAIPTNPIGGPVDEPPPGPPSDAPGGGPGGTDPRRGALSEAAQLAASVPAGTNVPETSALGRRIADATNRAAAAGATQEEIEAARAGQVPQPSPFEQRASWKSLPDVESFLSQARMQSPQAPVGKPVQRADGSFTFALPGEPEFDALEDARNAPAVRADRERQDDENLRLVESLTRRLAQTTRDAQKARDAGETETADNAEALAGVLRERLQTARAQLESTSGTAAPGTNMDAGTAAGVVGNDGVGDAGRRALPGGGAAAGDAGLARPEDGAVTPEGVPVAPADGGGARPVVLQNRDRSGVASVTQMQSIAANPDPKRLSFSRDFGSGAPVVFVNADALQVQPVQLGREDTVTDAQGRQYAVQYAVVEADEVVASNSADGTPNDLYQDSATPGLIRAVAGNGRMAGLQEAYRRGTATGYAQGIAGDAALHGVDPAVIDGMANPVLVRIMRSADVTPDIGDRSNVSGAARLNPVEQARTDMARVNLETLDFTESGDPTSEAVKAFVAAMPESERSELMTRGGAAGRQAIDRLMAATFAKAYGDDSLVELYAQATDPEARNVLSAMAQAAGAMARLDGAGPLDVRPLVRDAAAAAVNAARRGVALSRFAQQVDMTAAPETRRIVEMFARNARSSRKMAEALRSLADLAYSEVTKADADMFGEVPRRTRAQVIEEVFGGQGREDDAGTVQNAGRDGVDGQGAGGQDGREDERPAAGDAGQPQGEGVDRTAGGQADDFALTDYTLDELEQRRAEQEQQQAEADQAGAEQARRDAAPPPEDFVLSGSDRDADLAAARRQMELAPAEPVSADGAAPQRTPQEVVDAFRSEFSRIPRGMTREQFRDFHDRRRAAEARAAQELVEIAQRDGVRLPSRNGDGMVMLSPEAATGGESWRITRFLANGEPYGHTEFNTPDEAAVALMHEARSAADLSERPEQASAGIGRDGLTEKDRASQKMRVAAAELAGQIAENSRDEDFDAAELPGVIRSWANDSRVPADELRQEVIKRLRANADLGAAIKKKVERALDPTRRAPEEQKPKNAERLSALADYFAPGNIVTGYGGAFDRVLEFRPGEDGKWAVKVEAVRKEGDAWVATGRPSDARWHSTMPGKRELDAGPVERAQAKGEATPTAPVFATYADAQAWIEERSKAAGGKKAVETRETDAGVAMFSRSDGTRLRYEARIDALFAGEKAARVGAKVLDRSDVLDMLGLGDGPVHLAESKVLDGRENHPHMTADVWKKIPQWIEDPAAVFVSDTVSRRLTFIAPDTVGGAPVLVIVEPNVDVGAGDLRVHILVNAYDKDSGKPPFGRWVRDGLARYVDQKKFPAILAQAGLQLPSTAQNKPGTRKILTEKNLAAYRRAAMSRGAGSGLSVEAATGIAAAVRKAWANGPEVVVVADMTDLRVPERVRKYDAEQRSQGAVGEPEGFYYDGKVYLVAGQLGSPADVVRVLAHESLGHYGLRGLFGGELGRILDQIAAVRRKDVTAKLEGYGLPDTVAGRRVAAEEVLAVMAQTNPQLGFVRRAVAAIRTWLRGLGVNLRMTDDEIIRNFIIPARQWVERGGRPGTGMPAFSRPAEAFNNASGNFNPDLDRYWINQGRKEINGDSMSDADYNIAVAEYANEWRIAALLEQLGWHRRGASNQSSSTYYEKFIEPDESDVDGDTLVYEVRVSDHADRHSADGTVTRRFQVNFRGELDQWSDVAITPDMSTAEAMSLLRGTLEADPDARLSRGDVAQSATDVTPLGFYSELARRIESGPGRADAANWKAFIKSQKGIKPDEIEWTGINEFLDIQPGKITKEAVREYLAANGVRVEEFMLGGAGSEFKSMTRAEMAQAYERIVGYDPVEDDPSITDDELRDLLEGYARDSEESDGITSDGRPATKFGRYTLPGGENYREVLLTLPASRDAERLRELQLATVSGRATLEQRMERAAFEDRGVRDTAFRSLHWYQPNVLAHVRFDERTDADGKRVLFINELQSDWGQRGRKHGFKTDDRLIDGHDYDWWSKEADRLLSAKPFDREAVMRAAENRNALAGKPDEVPRAPFVEKTEAWVALLLKRMIRYAAENGFDRVAIVTGEQAADMFDLSKQVDRVVVAKTGGAWAVNAWRGGEKIITRDAPTDADLEQLVGKEFAARAIKNGGGDYSGFDLKVGGEGMRGFYDKIVPTVAKDVLRKLGGGKIGTISLSEPRYFVVDSKTGFSYEPTVSSRERAESLAAGWNAKNESGGYKGMEVNAVVREARQEQPAFDITPQMRDAVLEQGMPLFSRRPTVESVQAAVGQAAQAVRGATLAGTWRQVVNAWTDVKPMSLQFLGRRQIVDVYGDLLPQLTDYSNRMQQYDADKNESAAAADDVVRKWRRLPDADRLADVMHGATLAGYDPDASKTPADMLTPEMREVYDGFVGLSPDAKALYREARDAYRAHWNAVKAAIGERIERADIAENDRRALMEKYRDQFLKPIEGVYFPLARFGDYVITAKDAEGNNVVAFAETMTQAQAEQARLQRDHQDVSKITRRREYNAARDSVSKEFVRQLFTTIDKSSVDGQQADMLKDAVNQLYLTSLPDVSWAKHGIHRKGVAGYSRDARRAFAANMFHGGYHLAKLRHADVLQDYLREMQEHVEAQRTNAAYDSVTGQMVADEMVKRHDQVMNPDNNPLANTLTGLGFVWFLGLSPASAIVNLSQTALVAYPVIAARYGYGATADALTRASKEAMVAKNDLRGRLRGDEAAAYERAIREGLIDITQAHDLAGIAEGRDSGLQSKFSPVMRAASWMFHQAEKFNRQATFLAAYRLARGKGAEVDAAYDIARDLTYKGHFDYACVDAETECLTLDGWKRYDELREGDVAVAVDADGRAVESRIRAVNIHRGAIPVTKFQSRQFSMVLTDNHDCVIQSYNSRDRKWQSIRKVRADDLKPSHHLLRTPSAAMERTAPKYGKDFAALLGWVAAEGWYAKYRKCKAAHDVRIAQSLSHNPQYVDEIRGILDRLGGEYKEYVSEKRQMAFFVLRRSLGERIQAAMPDKLLTSDMLRDMPADEMAALVDAFSKGDGHHRGGTDWAIGQKDGQNLDVLQAMAVMLGMRASQSPVDKQGRGMLHLGRAEAGHRSHVRPMTKERAVVDMVWCPTTEHGTWIARRGGRVFVTGNSSNRPRVMMGPVARVALLFKQYGQNMIYTLARNGLLAARGDKEALKTLSGVLVGHALTAGVLGLPLASVLLGAASLIGGSDDEPWDAEAALRNYLADALGPALGEVVSRGVFRSFFPGDIASRVGLDSLLIRDIDLTLEPNKVWQEILNAVLGPIAGIGMNVAYGTADLARGDLMRGLQGMLPKAVSDGFKALRYWKDDGVVDRTGIDVLDEVTTRDLLAQVAGFTPARVSEAYAGRRAIMDKKRGIEARRESLLRDFSTAVIDKDQEKRLRALQEIQHFNQANPTMAITQQSMLRSIQNRVRRRAESSSGVYLPRRQRELEQEGRFANVN